MGTYVNSKELVEKAIYSEGKKKIFLGSVFHQNNRADLEGKAGLPFINLDKVFQLAQCLRENLFYFWGIINIINTGYMLYRKQ